MPELPEVEVLVRHLGPLVRNKVIQSATVRRLRIIRPTSLRNFKRTLRHARFMNLTRRGKYLLFEMASSSRQNPTLLVGHLGMTGRMYLAPKNTALPKHAAVVLELERENFIFEDTRYFGRLTLDTAAVQALGPEPLGTEFTPEILATGLARSAQPVKVRLLDQTFIAGVGNIYASEALFRAGISPRTEARRLKGKSIEKLWSAVRETLAEAIDFGSTVSLDYAAAGPRTDLFYYGKAPEETRQIEERLLVYDREKQPCLVCGTLIKRIVQASRSTFLCPRCQKV